MTALNRASIGYLLRHPWQLALALLGITIGVAVMVAVDLANESSRKAFLLSMDTLNGEATHQVVGGPAELDESVYVDLRVEHGVRSIAPIVTGPVLVGDRTLQLMGVDIFAERGFRSFTAVQAFRSTGTDAVSNGSDNATRIRGLLSGSAAVIMSSSVAAELGIVPGQRFELDANGRTYSAELLAVLQGEADTRAQNLLIADIATAQHWLGMDGRLSRIDVRIADGEEELYERISSALPPDAALLSASGRTATTAAMSDAFMTNLAAMSLLAMLVGVFLIYNSIAFAVLQRRELIGTLRALGVTRGQIFRLILLEAAVLGIVGVALGVGAGLLLGQELLTLVSRTLSDHYFAVTVTDVTLGLPALAKGAIAGFAATLAAAAFPAYEAAVFPPQLAMTRSVIENRAGRAVPLLSLLGIGMMLAAALLVLLSGTSLFTGLVALFLLILGFGFCIPRLVRFLSTMLAPVAAYLGGVPGRMATSGIGQTLSRTAVAIVALAIAVSATIGVSVMVDSFRGSVAGWLEATLQSDIYVGVRRGSLDPALVEDIAALPGVAALGSSRRSWLETASGRTRLVAIEAAPGVDRGTPLRDGDPATVWPDFDSSDVVLVSDSYAYRNDVAPGDTINLPTASGVVLFRVAAVYVNYDANDGALLISRATYNRHFDDPGIDSIGVYLQPGVDGETMMERIRALSSGRQALIMSSNRQLRELSLGIFDRTFVITDVLYWLAVGVAIVGILGAMLALQLERTREFGVLRAVGMTPVQTGSLVGMQSAVIGLFAGLASIPLGLAMAWVLIHVINRRAFGWQIDITVSPGVTAAALLIAVAAALVGGIYPAWYAARVRPALAMREE